MMERINDLILLTGAGFTKNFGGFLAKEMWSKIFNHNLVQGDPIIKAELLKTHDFELSYSNIMESNLSSEIKERINKVIFDAYKSLDASIKNIPLMRADTCNTYSLHDDLLTLFIHRKDGTPGMFFTLNQDLLMERHFNYYWPGIPKVARVREPYVIHTEELSPGQVVTLSSSVTKEDVIKDFMDGDFGYFKLHGSYGWKSSDGSNQMVIGKNKSGSIAREPLLRAYFDIFEEAIKSGGKKLWIIGYGFGDQHINDVIVDGIVNHSLGIYLITTSDLETLKKNMGAKNAGVIIDQGLRAYFPYKLGEIYPIDQGIQTTERADILHKLRTG